MKKKIMYLGIMLALFLGIQIFLTSDAKAATYYNSEISYTNINYYTIFINKIQVFV